jgi:hypothetical protein
MGRDQDDLLHWCPWSASLMWLALGLLQSREMTEFAKFPRAAPSSDGNSQFGLGLGTSEP